MTMQSIKHPDYINLPKAARGRRSRNAFPPFKMIVSFFGLTCLLWPTAISAFSSSGNTADSCTPPPPPFKVTRRAIAGLWRLTPQPTYPLKEFTVHPKKKKLQQRLSAKGWTRDQHKKELLLILNEDGSFQQYMESLSSASDEEDDEKVDLNDQWSQFQQSQQLQQKNIDDIDDDNDDDDDTSSLSLLSNHLAKGVWDYVDGKLILAADRPSATNGKDDHQPKGGPSLGSSSKVGKHSVVASSGQSRLDKLIVGRVVASTLSSTQTRQQQRQPNPQLPPTSAELSDSSKDTMQADKQTGDDDNTLTSTTPSSNQQPDTSSSTTVSSSFNTNLLSVPKGSLKMGKFFYPKNHPSFFDQPIFNPTTATRRFELKQILGSVKPDAEQRALMDGDDIYSGKAPFERSDFYNKTFLLSSHPLRQPKKPTNSNPFQRESSAAASSSLFKKRRNDNENKINPLAESSYIRVMQIKFFPNNTFATLWGTGDVILRGKFDTFVRDTYGGRFASQSNPSPTPTVALWMQIMRFGFGRSVSGSVYSEGRSLTQDDAKTYWGTIRRVNVTVLGEGKGNLQNATTLNRRDSAYEDVVVKSSSRQKSDNDSDDGNSQDDGKTVPILEVEGSVLFGTGVGAEPVGRFLMREMMQDMGQEEEDDEEEDDDDVSSFTLTDFTLDKNYNNLDSASNNGNDEDGVDWSMYGEGSDAFQ